MGIRSCREKEHQNQQRDNNGERGEYDQGVPVCVIVDLHHDEHHRQPQRCGDELFERKIVRIAKSLLGHDCRRAENHRHAESDENQRYEKEDAIRFQFLCHVTSASE
jgi:hypothetical protein